MHLGDPLVKIECLVVDDEPLARRVLERFIDAVPSLRLGKSCGSAAEAAAYMMDHRVDALFLDIKMPQMNGLEFLKTLGRTPQVILTTAYAEFALEGYEYAVVDYLLKPISFQRFLKAVNRLKPGPADTGHRTAGGSVEDGILFIKSDKVHHRIRILDIMVVQGWGNYVKIFTDTRTVLAARTLKSMVALLPADRFIRCHKSFIVNLSRCETIEEGRITIADRQIPVGRRYRMRVRDTLDRLDHARRD